MPLVASGCSKDLEPTRRCLLEAHVPPYAFLYLLVSLCTSLYLPAPSCVSLCLPVSLFTFLYLFISLYLLAPSCASLDPTCLHLLFLCFSSTLRSSICHRQAQCLSFKLFIIWTNAYAGHRLKWTWTVRPKPPPSSPTGRCVSSHERRWWVTRIRTESLARSGSRARWVYSLKKHKLA